MRPSLCRPQWQNFKEMLHSGSVNYSWRNISCNEGGGTTWACFSSFPHAFSYPSFPHPPTPEPPATLPATPQDLQRSANESSTVAFLPRDKNLQVWCSPSLCLSSCLTPIKCWAPNDSTSQSYWIGKVHSMWVFMVTTPGHDNCLPGEAMNIKKTFAVFISHYTELKFLHLQTFDSNSKSNQGCLWSTSHISSPLCWQPAWASEWRLGGYAEQLALD